jgi:multiple sugar transport system permease protein
MTQLKGPIAAEASAVGPGRGEAGQPFITARVQERIAGILFVLPSLLPLITFLLIPILASFVLVFADYPLLTEPKWIGTANLERLFSDKRMLMTFRNTALLVIGTLIFNNLLGLLLAMAVNRKMPRVLSYFFRTSFFFPFLTTTASLAVVWRFLLAQDRGVLNWFLSQIGIGPFQWTTSAQLALPSVLMYDVWKTVGFFMILYLAGLQAIPESLYEAAKIDGANSWQLTRHITLPLLTPTAFFCFTISCIGAFQIFDNAAVLTGGGPGDASRTVVMYIYENAFRRYEMGYASAVALVLLVVIASLTVVQFVGSKRWVHYE